MDERIQALQLCVKSMLIANRKLTEKVARIERDLAQRNDAEFADRVAVPIPVEDLGMQDILRATAIKMNLTVDLLRGRDGRRRVSVARQSAMLLMHEAGYTSSQIGNVLGRDHTTVLHGIRAAKSRCGS